MARGRIGCCNLALGFFCFSREEIGITMAALCLWKIYSAGGQVSVYLTRFGNVLSDCIWILIRLVSVRSRLISFALIWREKEVSGSYCTDPDHLISLFTFRTLWKSLQNNRYNMLVVRSFNFVQN